MSDTIHINTKKPRKTMSATTHKEDVIYPAHLNKAPGLVTYVKMEKYKELLEILRLNDLENEVGTLNER